MTGNQNKPVLRVPVTVLPSLVVVLAGSTVAVVIVVTAKSD